MLAKTKDGCRALTYLDLNALWSSHNMPFRQLETNRLLTDRFPTSWSVQRGHHFYMWMNSRSSLNPFRRNSRDGLTKHNKFATRCAKVFARLFPSKHRTRTKYKVRLGHALSRVTFVACDLGSSHYCVSHVPASLRTASSPSTRRLLSRMLRRRRKPSTTRRTTGCCK